MSRVRLDASTRVPLEELREEAPPQVTQRAVPYVELTVRSNYSFLQGGSSPEALIACAAELGYPTLGFADRDGLYGSVRALEEAHRRGMRLVYGCELTLDAWPDGGTEATRPEGERATLTVFVENHAGYTNLCRLLTKSHELHPKGEARRPGEGVPRNTFAGLPLEELAPRTAGLWALAHAPFHEGLLGPLHELFGERLSLALVRRKDGHDTTRRRAAHEARRRYGTALVATGGVLYAVPEHKPMLDVLHCIREGITLDEAGRALTANAEAYLRSPEAMVRFFDGEPEAVARTLSIAEACTFSLRELHYKFPCEKEPGASADEVLRRKAYRGARQRYGDALDEKVLAQLEKELTLIEKLEVAPYFLCVESIVAMARERDILCQGRGSAANSAVCFCLGITAVDPARSNLLFERFLSAERAEPPDIDVDFEHERREEVIQAIYQRYGRHRAAMVSEVIAYRGKSALREVGKVFGFNDDEGDRLATLVSFWDDLRKLEDTRVAEAGFDPADGRVRQVLAVARALQGYPRHLSVHVGGFVLSEGPLDEVAPVEPATMPGRTVIPWDKDDIDVLRFFKVDVLGLGMLTAVRKCLAFVQAREENGGAQGDARVTAATAIDQLARIPPEDPAVYDALCKADTVGVFQIESRAQMAMLPRLRPRKFYDLVVEVAIVRPGPIQGGMVHPYLRRRTGEEAVDVPHPCLAPILERTLGVPIFQEQVMQIAITGAGYTGGEADQLRRDMAAWRKTGNLERHKERLARGFSARGISQEFADRLYQQIHGFGEYGFPESHAASFALLVYASAWLKVHHPAAFAAAFVNSQPMGFYSASTLLQDAHRHGVELLPPCIRASDWDCTLEPRGQGSALRVGLRQVKGLGEAAGKRIEEARRTRPFASLEDLALRAALNRKELAALAESGALDPLTGGRREALWKVFAPRGEGLFAGLDLGDEPPKLPAMTRAQQLVLDYERTGLSVKDHPMLLARPRLPRGTLGSADLAKARHGAVVTVAGLVICRQRPQTASGVVFLTLEDEHGFLNLVLFTDVFDRYRPVATTSTLLLVRGRVEREREGAIVYVRAEHLERLGIGEADDTPRSAGRREDGAGAATVDVPSMSRDFH